MNRKGRIGDILLDYVIHLILLLMFSVAMFFFIGGQQDGGDIWAQFYSEEIVKVVDASKPGDEVVLDVHKATEIAKGDIDELGKIFEFDNSLNRACVKLRKGRTACFSYFSDVDVVDCGLRLGIVGAGVNTLEFKIVEDRGTNFTEPCERRV